jgi:hypothetical protein
MVLYDYTILFQCPGVTYYYPIENLRRGGLLVTRGWRALARRCRRGSVFYRYTVARPSITKEALYFFQRAEYKPHNDAVATSSVQPDPVCRVSSRKTRPLV